MRGQKILGAFSTIAGTIGLLAILALGAAVADAATQAEALLEGLRRGPGPSKGSPDAPLTIVEFSDFQCTYCRKFWRETLPLIEENYIRAVVERVIKALASIVRNPHLVSIHFEL